jgi:hypothetical protein
LPFLPILDTSVTVYRIQPRKDIRDEMVKEIRYETENDTDEITLKLFLLKIYANIALANLKLYHFREAENACNEMLRLDPFNARGLYLRSQSRLRPKSSYLEEKKKGCRDLWLASKYNPHDPFLRLVMRLPNTTMPLLFSSSKKKMTFHEGKALEIHCKN